MTVCAEFAGRSGQHARGIQGCVLPDLMTCTALPVCWKSTTNGGAAILKLTKALSFGGRKAIDAAIAHLRFNAGHEGRQKRSFWRPLDELVRRRRQKGR